MDRPWGNEELDMTEQLALHSQVITEYWVEFSVLYNSYTVISFMCSSVYVSVPISQFIPPSPLGINIYLLKEKKSPHTYIPKLIHKIYDLEVSSSLTWSLWRGKQNHSTFTVRKEKLFFKRVVN